MLAASKQVGSPMFFGVLIITVVYMPILALTGIEGKMFHPMALTVMLALGGALVLALTLMPVLCSFVLRGKIHEGDNCRHPRSSKRSTRRCSTLALRLRWLVVLRCGRCCLPARSGCSRASARSSFPSSTKVRITAMLYKPVGMSMEESLRTDIEVENRLLARISRNHARLLPHRHERNRHRPDAAERKRRLHLLQAARRMAQDAGPPVDQGGVARADRSDAQDDQSRLQTFSSLSPSRCASTKCSKARRPNCR